MTAYYSIEMTHPESIMWFLNDYHTHKVPSSPPGHSKDAISVKLNFDVAQHTADAVRYHGVFLSPRWGRVFIFFLNGVETNMARVVYLLDGPERGDLPHAPRILDYTILAVDNQTPGSIVGTIKNSSNEVIVGATVTIKKGVFEKSTVTIAAGTYAIAGVPVDTGYSVYAVTDGYPQTEIATDVEIKEGVETDLGEKVLDNYGSIAGTVTDATTNPIVAAQLSGVGRATGTSLTGASDEDGKYLLMNVVPDTYDIVVTMPGYVTDTMTLKNLLLTPGQTVTDKDVVLGRHAIWGGAVTHTNEAIEGAVVSYYSVYPSASPVYQATVDAAGKYVISGMLPGVYQVHVTADGYVSQGVMDRVVAINDNIDDDNWVLAPVGP